VDAESTRYLKLLERRLALLDALATGLKESRNDFVAMDLPAMERCIAEQEQLCGQIRSLDGEISTMQAKCAGRVGMPARADAISWPGSPDGDRQSDAQILALLGRISAAQVDLKKLNDAHQAMLRRSRRTVQVLVNLFNSYAPTYSAPASVGSSYEERA